LIFGKLDSHASGRYAVTVTASDHGVVGKISLTWKVDGLRDCD
jgi:hypothetical protein